MYQRSVLDNGIRVVSCPMPQRRSLALGFWLRTGSRYEMPASAGISHFLEHMVFKGTKSFSCQQIKEAIEGVGGSFNGFTSEELTCYYVKMPSQYLRRAADILAEMVLVPLVRRQDLVKERTVILEEIKMYKDLPQSYVYELLDQLLWPGHPLGTSTLGSRETVSAITRDDLLAYRGRFYTPAHIVVSASGGFRHPELVAAVARRCSRLPADSRIGCLEASVRQEGPQTRLLDKDTEQSHLAMGFHGISRNHPDKHALRLAHIILGANSSSRLFNEVREKRGLAYEIGTMVKHLNDTGSFIVHAGVDNAKVEDALKLVMQQLARMKRVPVSNGELQRAREFYLGQLMLAMEDTLDQMFWIGESTATLDRVFTLEEVVRQVNKVSPADIRRICSEVFCRRHLNLALIGPQGKRWGCIEKLLDLP